MPTKPSCSCRAVRLEIQDAHEPQGLTYRTPVKAEKHRRVDIEIPRKGLGNALRCTWYISCAFASCPEIASESRRSTQEG